MIPILYDADLQDAWSISNGIGRLSDAISCDVNEERNGSYTARIVYPINGIHAKDIATNRIIKTLAGDKTGIQCFRVQSVNPTLDGKKITVSCNHVSYDLSYFPVNPFDGSVISPATAFQILWRNEINQIPFVFDPEFYMLESAVAFGTKIPKSTRSMLMGSEGSILDIFGGEFEFDNRNIIWKRERGTDNGVRIAYGKNLTSFEQEINIAETVCGILPYWTSDGTTITGSIQYSDNAANFPFPKVKTIDFSQEFNDPENPPTAADLNAKATSYITANNVGYPQISTTVEFLPLWQEPGYEAFKNFERVGLCDTVTVFVPEFNVNMKAKVVKTDFNSLLERYNSVTIGTVKTTIADVVARLT